MWAWILLWWVELAGIVYGLWHLRRRMRRAVWLRVRHPASFPLQLVGGVVVLLLGLGVAEWFRNRQTHQQTMTWVERLSALEVQGQGSTTDMYTAKRYPHLLGVFALRNARWIAHAARETAAPIHVSKEWYADMPEQCVVYKTQPGDLERFWQAYDRLKTQEGHTEWWGRRITCGEIGAESLEKTFDNGRVITGAESIANRATGMSLHPPVVLNDCGAVAEGGMLCSTTVQAQASCTLIGAPVPWVGNRLAVWCADGSSALYQWTAQGAELELLTERQGPGEMAGRVTLREVEGVVELVTK